MDYFITRFAQVTQGIDGLYVAGEDLENEISSLSFRAVAISAVVLIVLTLIAVLLKDHAPKLKTPLFIGMSFTMAFSFLLLAGSTIYLNLNSDSGGPVHWHADVEYWACGNQLELRNPTGTLSNKIGTSTLHEHDDQRIHLEGVVVDGVKDASLGKFMYVVDGTITDSAIVMPLNAEQDLFEDNVDNDGDNVTDASLIDDRIVTQGDERFFRALDGQNCGEQTADVQVFVYQFNDGENTYSQTKLERPQDYIIRDNPNVPPGDCVIFEFDITKPYTDKLCEQYAIRDIQECQEAGIDSPICELTDVTNYEQLDAEFNSLQLIETEPSIPAENEVIDDEIPADDLNAIAPTDTIVEQRCEPYFNADGTASDFEQELFGDLGETLDPNEYCAEYQQDLQSASTTEVN